jgi:hypothetical protein
MASREKLPRAGLSAAFFQRKCGFAGRLKANSALSDYFGLAAKRVDSGTLAVFNPENGV